MKFSKKVKTLDESIELLLSRDLNIPDKKYAKRYLGTIGYYRLSGYFLPFYSSKDKFSPDTEFNDILDLYIFDRKLRLIVMDAMERIEVAIRTTMSNELSVKYKDPHWFFNQSAFQSWYKPDKLDRLYKDIEYCTGKNRRDQGGRNNACRHYYPEYDDPKYPPSWVITEVLSMGTCSVIFEALAANKVKQKISRQFKVNSNDFGNWVHGLTLIRNDCAHHSRFWNTSHALKATNVAKYTYKDVPLRVPYVKFVLIKYFMDQLFTGSTWTDRLEEHLQTCPLDYHCHMGFPQKWRDLPFWE